MDHYRNLEPLGGGGMGVVYRAEDTRLGRTVALKFLPPEMTRDPVAKARFLQEARTASALDHPNICTIYDVGETSDGRLFLAMPCYDGETLRDRLERGPLPVDEAVDIAWQIGRGLSKAHRQGIVHRDIKPANLMVTGDGVVKILDFGIAKLAGAAGITTTGIPLGTPAYMAPEQMRGAEVDGRTDLWALGVVLYEMLAGRRPFPGDHEVVVRHGVLNSEPEPLSKVRADVSRDLERVVGRLLAKDPAGRYSTADDLLGDLRPMVTSPSGTRATAVLSSAGTHVRRRRLVVAGIAAAALVLLAFGAFLGLSGWGRREAPIPSVQTRLTRQPGIEAQPTLSPNGELFAYVKTVDGRQHIFLQRPGGDARDLSAEAPADDSEPAFSPDGNLIAFRSERDGGGLFQMGATGESVRRLTDSGYDPAWSPDGKEIAYATAPGDDPRDWGAHSRLWRLDLATFQRRPVADVDAAQPSWSPNGHRIAYWSVEAGSGRRTIWTISAEPGKAGEPVAVTQDNFYNWSPAWSPDGRHLYFASDRQGSMNLWRVPIDEESGRVRGPAEAVTNSSQWNGPLRLAADGRILYAARDERSNLEKVAFDAAAAAVSGLPSPIDQSSQAVSLGAVSPDGRWLVFRSMAPQEDLFLVHPDGTGVVQLTHDEAKDRGPVWMPDGRILFFSDRSSAAGKPGRYEAWTIRADGSDLRQLTDSHGEGVFRPLVSPDGRWLVGVFGLTGTVRLDLARPAAARTPEALPAPAPGMGFYPNSWSPDGRLLLGTGTGTGFGIYVYDTAARTYQKLAESGAYPVWMHDGRRLLYLDQGKIRLLDSRTREARDVLTPPLGSAFSGLDLSPDERTLYLGRTTPEGDIWMLSLPAAGEAGK